ncbi:MAG: integrase core domain-containing protein [Janthinobacterium lividum]
MAQQVKYPGKWSGGWLSNRGPRSAAQLSEPGGSSEKPLPDDYKEWLRDYNTQRPHQALNFATPLKFKPAA